MGDEEGGRREWYSGCCMEWCRMKMAGNTLYYERSLNEFCIFFCFIF